MGSFQRCRNIRWAAPTDSFERHSYPKLEVLCVRCDDPHLLCCRSVMHRLWTRGGERDAADQDILANGARLQVCKQQVKAQLCKTYDCAEDVTFVWVLVTHPEIGQDGCPVLGDRRVMHSFDLVELIRMHQIQRGCSDELVWLETWNAVSGPRVIHRSDAHTYPGGRRPTRNSRPIEPAKPQRSAYRHTRAPTQTPSLAR